MNYFGFFDGTIGVSAKAIIKVIRDLDALKNSDEFSLEEVYFVTNRKNYLAYFQEKVEPEFV